MMWNYGDRKIRIFSKKLASGNCQVKFYIDSPKDQSLYGYMLVESGKTVSDVILLIYDKLKNITCPENYYHGHLFHIGHKPNFDPEFILYPGARGLSPT